MRSKSVVTESYASGSFIRLVFLALILVATVGLVSTHLGYARSFTRSVGVAPYVPLKVIEEQGDLEVQSVVALPDDEFLVVATTGDSRSSSGELRGSCYFRFAGNGSQLYSAHILGTGSLGEGRRSIRCSLVQQEPRLRLDQSTQVSVKLEHLGGSTIATSSSQIPLFFWNRLVFESLVTDQDVVLFTKGILPARKEDQERALLNQTKCVFLDITNTHILAETVVLGISQEVIRCRHPPLDLRYSLLGNKVSITTHRGAIPEPSVVFYDVPRITDTPSTGGGGGGSQLQTAGGPADARKRHRVCACTMIYNGAKFLHEWIQYHSHLGVEKFILYDNNSEDKLEQTVQELNTDGFAATVATRTWPWIKTQESGFSHCALTSKSECEWMAFVDVDEYLYPRHWLPKGEQKETEPPEEAGKGAFFAVDQTVLSRVINDAEKQKFPDQNVSTGQISFYCREFGPSGLTRHPAAGVTQGYTCRRSREQRHKSLVRLDALDRSLTNVIHHFRLSPGFSTVSIPTWKGVVNHYKYQAWEEFKLKFKRRVSAYVVDWKEGRNINSQDRTPGLGKDAVKPENWERQFCEVEDTGLKEYIAKLFRPRTHIQYH